MNQLEVKAHGLSYRLAIQRHSQEILVLVWALDCLGKKQGALWSRNIRSSGLRAFLRLATHCRKRYKSANSSQKNEAKQKPHLMHKDIKMALWDVRQNTRFLVTRSDCNTFNNLLPIYSRSIQGFLCSLILQRQFDYSRVSKPSTTCPLMEVSSTSWEVDSRWSTNTP